MKIFRLKCLIGTGKDGDIFRKMRENLMTPSRVVLANKGVYFIYVIANPLTNKNG